MIFSNKTPFGLNISNHSIEIVQLSGSFKLDKIYRKPLENGLIENGFIKDKETLLKRIINAVEESGVESNKVIFAVPEDKTFIHFFNNNKNVKEKASKLIPLKPSDLYDDLIKTEEGTIYVSAEKDIVDSWYSILIEAGLEPIVFDIESLALSRAFIKGQKSNIAIIDIGFDTTSINLFNDSGDLKESFTAQEAGNHWTEAIADELDISFEEAEELKKEIGFLGGKGDKEKVKKVLEKGIEPIIQEFNKAIEVYTNELELIILAGGSSHIPGLPKYIEEKFNVHTTLAKSPLLKDIEEDEQQYFDVAVGLAMRGVYTKAKTLGINLLPKEVEEFFSTKMNKKRITYISGSLVLATVLIIAGGLFYKQFFITAPAQVIKALSTNYRAAINNNAPIFSSNDSQSTSTNANSETVTSTTKQQNEETIEEVKVNILDTPTGWLRVRDGAGTEYPEITKVYPGDSYTLLDESEEWYYILIDENTTGWVFKDYADLNN